VRGRDESDVPLSGRKVVVADDDPAVAWFLSGLLKTVGAEVIEAHDGVAALELVRDSWPDLVVSDILMPRLDGFSLCRALKQDVAVRDVPVILLSWKEDLLPRVRELGAEADGYLRKEAAASTVVRRIREVMRPRARVEARLAQGGEVRGRLDGLTPRLVLELCCRSGGDLRVEIRDAFFEYVLQVRRGRLVAANRAGAGELAVVRGDRVVRSLLGVNAGRFLVTPDEGVVSSDFDGPLGEVLKPSVDRARMVQTALSSERLAEVTRVVFNGEELDHYLTATPEPMRLALMQLKGGVPPRDLLLGGRVSPEVLVRTLADVARRGCIELVERSPGSPEPGPELEREPEREPEPALDAEPRSSAEPAAGGSSLPAAIAQLEPFPPAQPGPHPTPAAERDAVPQTEPGPNPEPEPDPDLLATTVKTTADPLATTVKKIPDAAASTDPPTNAPAEPQMKESNLADDTSQDASRTAFSFQLSPEPPPASYSFRSIGPGWVVPGTDDVDA
jgi:CheY-like chemotaxis protein